MRNQVWLFAVALLASACTTSLYNGPRRSSSELAYLVSDESFISRLDGFEAPYSGGNFAKYEILPGEHVVGVSLNKIVGGGAYRANSPYTLCLDAKAGKQYRVKIDMVGVHWRAYMIEDGLTAVEDDLTARVNHPCQTQLADSAKPKSMLNLSPRK